MCWFLFCFVDLIQLVQRSRLQCIMPRPHVRTIRRCVCILPRPLKVHRCTGSPRSLPPHPLWSNRTPAGGPCLSCVPSKCPIRWRWRSRDHPPQTVLVSTTWTTRSRYREGSGTLDENSDECFKVSLHQRLQCKSGRDGGGVVVCVYHWGETDLGPVQIPRFFHLFRVGGYRKGALMVCSMKAMNTRVWVTCT